MFSKRPASRKRIGTKRKGSPLVGLLLLFLLFVFLRPASKDTPEAQDASETALHLKPELRDSHIPVKKDLSGFYPGATEKDVRIKLDGLRRCVNLDGLLSAYQNPTYKTFENSMTDCVTPFRWGEGYCFSGIGTTGLRFTEGLTERRLKRVSRFFLSGLTPAEFVESVSRDFNVRPVKQCDLKDSREKCVWSLGEGLLLELVKDVSATNTAPNAYCLTLSDEKLEQEERNAAERAEREAHDRAVGTNRSPKF
jgi:hypothetical protein